MVENTDFFLSRSQVAALLKIAKLRRDDIFYDLGAGEGLVIRMAVSQTPVRKAIGLEYNRKHFERSWKLAIDELQKQQLKRAYFWFGSRANTDTIENKYVYDFSDATAVYDSFIEDKGDIGGYKKDFSRKVRIIKKDLPLVGYEPAAVNRDNHWCWFFLHKSWATRVRNKDKWASFVLGKSNANIDDVYRYYRRQLVKRNTFRKDIDESINDLRRLVRLRFSV